MGTPVQSSFFQKSLSNWSIVLISGDIQSEFSVQNPT